MSGYVLQSILTTDETAYVLQDIEGTGEITVEWNIDTGNIVPADTVITNGATSEPTIEVTPRETLGGIGPTLRWIFWHFKVGNALGKRPIFQVNVAGRYNGNYTTDWRPQYKETNGSWTAAPSRTIISDIAEFQFTDAFTENEAQIADHQVYSVGNYEQFAITLANDSSGLVNPSAAGNASGVIGTSPAETDDLSRAVGEHNIYGFVLGDPLSPTDDGGPKRWMTVDAGIHSGEILDGWPLEGIVDFYINGVGALADKLRSNWLVGCYFCLTPNGRFGGNWRGNFRDTKDPNRDWGSIGAFSLAESVIVRDAILADLDGVIESVGLSLHTDAAGTSTERIYRSTAVSDSTIQDAWLDNLDTVDGTAWSRINTSIDSSVTGWHATRGAPVCVIPEFGTRNTNTVSRYQQTGQRFMEATAATDAEGLFFDAGVTPTAAISVSTAYDPVVSTETTGATVTPTAAASVSLAYDPSVTTNVNVLPTLAQSISLAYDPRVRAGRLPPTQRIIIQGVYSTRSVIQGRYQR